MSNIPGAYGAYGAYSATQYLPAKDKANRYDPAWRPPTYSNWAQGEHGAAPPTSLRQRESKTHSKPAAEPVNRKPPVADANASSRKNKRSEEDVGGSDDRKRARSQPATVTPPPRKGPARLPSGAAFSKNPGVESFRADLACIHNFSAAEQPGRAAALVDECAPEKVSAKERRVLIKIVLGDRKLAPEALGVLAWGLARCGPLELGDEPLADGPVTCFASIPRYMGELDCEQIMRVVFGLAQHLQGEVGASEVLRQWVVAAMAHVARLAPASPQEASSSASSSATTALRGANACEKLLTYGSFAVALANGAFELEAGKVAAWTQRLVELALQEQPEDTRAWVRRGVDLATSVGSWQDTGQADMEDVIKPLWLAYRLPGVVPPGGLQRQIDKMLRIRDPKLQRSMFKSLLKAAAAHVTFDMLAQVRMAVVAGIERVLADAPLPSHLSRNAAGEIVVKKPSAAEGAGSGAQDKAKSGELVDLYWACLTHSRVGEAMSALANLKSAHGDKITPAMLELAEALFSLPQLYHIVLGRSAVSVAFERSDVRSPDPWECDRLEEELEAFSRGVGREMRALARADSPAAHLACARGFLAYRQRDLQDALALGRAHAEKVAEEEAICVADRRFPAHAMGWPPAQSWA